MGNLNPTLSRFTTTDMVLTPLDTLGTVWGSALANNTGKLYMRPKTIISQAVATPSPSGVHTVMEGYIYLTPGTYLLYFDMQNPEGHDYIPADLVFYSSNGLCGTVGSASQASTGLRESCGSSTWVWEETAPVYWRLVSRHTDSWCYLSVYASRLNTPII